MGVRHQHVRSHTGHVQFARIGNAKLQSNRFNVALAAADVALGGEIAFHCLEINFAGDHLPAGHADLEGIAKRDVISVGFRNRGPYPGVAQIHDSDNCLSGIDYFTLACGAHRDRPVHRSDYARVAKADLGLLTLRSRAEHVGAGGGNGAGRSTCLVSARLGGLQICCCGAHLVLQRSYRGLLSFEL